VSHLLADRKATQLPSLACLAAGSVNTPCGHPVDSLDRYESYSALLVPRLSALTSRPPIPVIAEKPGAWDTLKLVNTAPTPNDARNFGSAFPIGNGRLGAKVFGWPTAEVIPLKDATFRSGPGPEHFEDPKHREALVATRAALAEPDYVKADQLVRGREGPNTQFYEPLADLHLNFPGHDTFTNYSNTLDLDTAVATTKYTVGGSTYTREMFVSIRLGDRAAVDGGQAWCAELVHGPHHPAANGQTVVTANEISVTGRAPFESPVPRQTRTSCGTSTRE